MSKTIYIATRGSALALAQANLILAQCRAAFPDQSFDLKIIKTTGDKLQPSSLASAELPKGLFTKEIEEALLAGEADLAVHSLKDLPTELPPKLKLGAVTRRADVRDVLVYRDLDGDILLVQRLLERDPHEQRNRWRDPEAHSVKTELLAGLAVELARSDRLDRERIALA